MERITTVTGADGGESLERALNELVVSGDTLRSVVWKEGAGYWVVWSTSGAPPATTTAPPASTTAPPTTTTEPPTTTTVPPPTTTEPV